MNISLYKPKHAKPYSAIYDNDRPYHGFGTEGKHKESNPHILDEDSCLFWNHNGIQVVKHFCKIYVPGTMTDINGNEVR